MIDFTSCRVDPYRTYGGANGQKIHISYNGKGYMLKFPPAARHNAAMSYSNGCISEYLACHIFESMGFRVQETLMGTYTLSDGRVKTVVACGDFNTCGNELMEFAKLKNACIDTEQNGYGTELSTILAAMEEQTLVDPIELREFFWDMFIADALLGNFDRHNGNWGLLVNSREQMAQIAPIYDCGSCLYPQLDLPYMEKILDNEEEIAKRIFVFPNSVIEDKGKKINYFRFISSGENADCTAALKRVIQRVNLARITEIIDSAPLLRDIQREFYKIMLRERYDKILCQSLDMLQGH